MSFLSMAWTTNSMAGLRAPLAEPTFVSENAFPSTYAARMAWSSHRTVTGLSRPDAYRDPGTVRRRRSGRAGPKPTGASCPLLSSKPTSVRRRAGSLRTTDLAPDACYYLLRTIHTDSGGMHALPIL